MHHSLTATRSLLLLAGLCALLATTLWPATSNAQDSWKVGEIVGLSEGTCIREGPGLSYRAHTRVPEDEWAVMVIGGPRGGSGKIWFDTSRREAGDPSGGTGWVDRSQTDMCPLDEEPSETPRGELPRGDDLLEKLRRWWRDLDSLMKWVVAIVLLALLIASWRTLSTVAFRLLGFVISGFILFVIADATREYWQSTWTGLVGPDAPDLALLVALIPVVSWGVAWLRTPRRR